MKLEKILIVDGSYMIHRALHVEQIFNLKNSMGVGTGGVFQFLRSLNSEMNNYPGYFPIVCWDDGLSARRVSAYPNYKNRGDTEDASDGKLAKASKKKPNVSDEKYIETYHDQRARVIELLKLLGIPSLMFYGWEGDDLMYILAKFSRDSVILTDDKDLIQLLSPSTRIYRPMAGELLEYESYQKEHHDPDMKKFIYEKCIVGDPSDNIPSCANGVGGKTAKTIAQIMFDNQDSWKNEVENSDNRRVRLFGNEQSYNQFNTNLQLIDLSLVEIPKSIIKDIANTINASVKVPNYLTVMVAMNGLEVVDLDVGGMVSKMTSMIKERGLS